MAETNAFSYLEYCLAYQLCSYCELHIMPERVEAGAAVS